MQRRFLNIAALVAVATAAATFVMLLVVTATTPQLLLTEKSALGGDFLAFYTAGEAALSGRAGQVYDFSFFDAALKAKAPAEKIGMMWQYPPTFFYVVALLALAPYKASYILWIITGWIAFGLALRRIGFQGSEFWLLVMSPLCWGMFASGQVSMFTAALLFLAAYAPVRHWLVAGIAAGLLTMKPQLGLLIPIAYASCGAWRAFLTASLVALGLVWPSFGLFEADAWAEFASAVGRLNHDMIEIGGNTPVLGMTTLYSQLRLLHIENNLALTLQYIFAFAAAICVGATWLSKNEDPLGRAAVLCAAALLATPYAYYYEMTLLAVPAAYIGYRASANGGTFWIGLYLTACAIAVAMRPYIHEGFILQAPFIICLSAFVLSLRAFVNQSRLNKAKEMGFQ